jgi:hypothetical protein
MLVFTILSQHNQLINDINCTVLDSVAHMVICLLLILGTVIRLFNMHVGLLLYSVQLLQKVPQGSAPSYNKYTMLFVRRTVRAGITINN